MEQWLERYRAVLFIILVVLILAAVVLFQLLRPIAQPFVLTTATPLPSPEATATPRPLRVYVSGAVTRPDVYTLPPDSIVKDALLAAGGPAENADLDRINLALPVSDGQQVYVPRLGEENPPVQPPSAQRAPDSKVNINTADLATLDTLPGIGPVIAQRIIDYRQANGPFDRIEGVMDVPGIGESTFEKIRDLITTD
jgi:competence protein ComEA